MAKPLTVSLLLHCAAALSFYNAVDKVIGETESRELSEFKVCGT
jgi:hypothetical protein